MTTVYKSWSTIEEYVVPEDLYEVYLEIAGGRGGDGDDTGETMGDDGASGGLLSGHLDVSPGDTLYIYTGDKGESGDTPQDYGGGDGGNSELASGGKGGENEAGDKYEDGGGGGGGASGVKKNSNWAGIADGGGGGGAGNGEISDENYDGGGGGGGGRCGDGGDGANYAHDGNPGECPGIGSNPSGGDGGPGKGAQSTSGNPQPGGQENILLNRSNTDSNYDEGYVKLVDEPAKPNVTTTPVSSTKIDVTFTSARRANKYDVKYTDPSGTTTTHTTITDDGSTDYNTSIPNLIPSENYDVWVEAINGAETTASITHTTTTYAGMQVYDGTNYIYRDIYVYDGSQWVRPSRIAEYDGSTWQDSW